MFRVDLRALERGPAETAGSLAADDPLFGGLDFVLDAPVSVTGHLATAGPGRYYWNGNVATVLRGECRRCLSPVTVPVTAPVSALFVEDAVADDPSAWSIERNATTVDLSAPIREELILAVPAYVLCRDDCRGICPGCGVDLNVGSCRCRPASDPRWAGLEALRERLSDDTR